MARIIEAAIWAAVATYGIRRLGDVADALILAWRPPPAPADELAEVPADLVAVAMLESEAWAQEETLKAMRERYDTLHDWNRVRAAFGVGRIDGGA
jgi:hypothetical protein